MLGTRGSALARAQTSLVEQALRAARPEVDLAVEIITTRGDEKSSGREEVPDAHAGRKGLFTGEIERALLDHEIDVAIHSAKDLPSDPTPGLEIGAVLPRASVEDVLVTKSGGDLTQLPSQAIVATGSVRRQHQLRWQRPDLRLVELRGNVPTRLRKLTANEWSGIVLARAGLERLGFPVARGTIDFERHVLQTSILSEEFFLPAGGQGIVALQMRSDDRTTRDLLVSVDHVYDHFCLRAEREFLRLLQGDCGTPVGVLATIVDGGMTIRAQVFDEGATAPRVACLRKAELPNEPEALGAELLELINGG